MQHYIYIWKMNKKSKSFFIEQKITLNEEQIEELMLERYKTDYRNLIDEEEYEYTASLENTII